MALRDFPLFADLVSYWPQIVNGLRNTILLSVTITITGLVGGVAVFGLAISRNRLLRFVIHPNRNSLSTRQAHEPPFARHLSATPGPRRSPAP